MHEVSDKHRRLMCGEEWTVPEPAQHADHGL